MWTSHSYPTVAVVVLPRALQYMTGCPQTVVRHSTTTPPTGVFQFRDQLGVTSGRMNVQLTAFLAPPMTWIRTSQNHASRYRFAILFWPLPPLLHRHHVCVNVHITILSLQRNLMRIGWLRPLFFVSHLSGTTAAAQNFFFMSTQYSPDVHIHILEDQ